MRLGGLSACARLPLTARPLVHCGGTARKVPMMPAPDPCPCLRYCRYTYTTLIKCIVDEPISGPVLVYITKPPNPAPLMTVNVDMPVAEGMETVR